MCFPLQLWSGRSDMQNFPHASELLTSTQCLQLVQDATLKNFRGIFFATWYQIRSSAADNNSSILAATMYNVVEEFLENYRLFISTAWPLVVLVWIVSTWDTGERVLESCSALGAWECGPLWTLFLSSLDMLDQRMAPSTYSRLFVSGTLEKGFWKLVQH